MIERVTVISLDRTPARYAGFLRTNPGLPIDRFSAVDGWALDRQRFVDDGLVTAGNSYKAGALGSLASHVALWRRCAAGRSPLHIAEDDALFRRDFIVASAHVLSTLKDWDIVLWGWNFDWPLKLRLAPGLGTAVLQGNQPDLRLEWRAFAETSAPPVSARLISAAGLPGYSISPCGAKALLSLSLPIAGEPADCALRPGSPWTNTALDVEMSRHYGTLAAYVSLPPLVATLNEHETSTIQISAAQVSAGQMSSEAASA